MYKVAANLRLEMAARLSKAPVQKGDRVLVKQAKDSWFLGTVTRSGEQQTVVLLDNGEKFTFNEPPGQKIKTVNTNRQYKSAMSDDQAKQFVLDHGEVLRQVKDGKVQNPVVRTGFAKDVMAKLRKNPKITLVALLALYYKHNKDKNVEGKSLTENYDIIQANGKSALRELKAAGIILTKVGGTVNPVFTLSR